MKFFKHLQRLFITKKFFWIELIIIAVYLIISITVSTLVSGQFYQSTLRTYIEKENEIRTQSLEREIGAVIDTVEEMSIKLLNSNRLSPRSISLDRVLSREMLFSFRNLNSYVENIYYDYGDDEYFMTFWGYLRKDLFYLFFDKDSKSIEEIMNNSQEPVLLNSTSYSSREIEYLLYMFPAVSEVTNERVTFTFRLNTDKLRQAMRAPQYEKTEKVYILLPNGEILLSADNEDYSALKETLSVPVQSSLNAGSVSLDGKTYYYCKVTAESGICFLRLISEDVYVQQAATVNLILILMLAFLLTAGFLFIFFIFRKSYRPLMNLVKSIKKEEVSKESAPLDELKTIEHAFATANEQNKQLKSHLESVKPARISLFVDELIRGHFSTPAEMQSACDDLGISLPHDYFAAICLTVTRGDEYDSFYEDARESMPSGLYAYFSSSPNTASYKGIINFPFSDAGLLKEQLETFRENLYFKKNLRVAVALGNITNDFRQLGYSYIAASNALQYRFLVGDGKVLSSDEISYVEVDTTPYPIQEINRLSLSISEWDAEKISQDIENIQKYMLSGQVSLRRARLICLDMIGIFCSAIAVVNRTMAIDLNNYFDIFSIADYTSVSDLRNAIELLSQRISKFIKENVNESTPRNINLLIEYLKTNIGNHQFSISTMADNFRISYKLLRKAFRKETGHSLIEHFNYLRLEETKRLLCTTSKNLDEIANQVGYESACSLIRKFKNDVGITPAKYRETYNVNIQDL